MCSCQGSTRGDVVFGLRAGRLCKLQRAGCVGMVRTLNPQPSKFGSDVLEFGALGSGVGVGWASVRGPGNIFL